MVDDPESPHDTSDERERAWSHLRRIAAALDLPPETFFRPASGAADRMGADRSRADWAMSDQALEMMRLFLQIDDAQVRRDCLSKIRTCHYLATEGAGNLHS